MNINKIPKYESDQVEFKESFSDDVIISLVAFANSKGGKVYVGIHDNGTISGVNLGKESINKWINEIKNKTNPSLLPDFEEIEVDGKKIVVLYTIEYPVKPVSMKARFYKRVSSSNHLMSITEIANEHLKTINSSWDFYIDSNHSLQHISYEKVNRCVEQMKRYTLFDRFKTADEFLEKFEIVRNNQLTFGAYLLFAKDYCAISDVQIGRFKGSTTIIDSLSLNSDIISEVDEIMLFIKKHLNVEYIITGEPQRTERFDYPPEAIREVIVNMIAHRDYRDSSASIIKIFDDRIEFYNPGRLYGDQSVSDLLSGNYVSKSRNKLIAKVFKELGLIESYGSGIGRIRKICSEYGLIEPEFKEVSSGFMVTLFNDISGEPKDFLGNLNFDPNFIPDGTVNEPYVYVYNPDGTVNEPDVTVNELDVTVNNHNDTVKEFDVTVNVTELILKIIKKSPEITVKLIANELRVSERTVKRNIKILKENSKLERIGSDKSGHWQVVENK